MNSTMLLNQRFIELEKQLEQLVGLMDNLAAENVALRQREQRLIKTCELLDQKNTKACQQIEAIITQLKQHTTTSTNHLISPQNHG